MVDVEAELVSHLAAVEGVTATGVDVPHNVEELLPFVAVRLLPGEEFSRTWQGATGHLLQATDIDLFTADLGGVEVARRIRSSLSGLRVRGMVPHNCPPLSRRPDWNPRIRVTGAEFEFIIRA